MTAVLIGITLVLSGGVSALILPPRLKGRGYLLLAGAGCLFVLGAAAFILWEGKILQQPFFFIPAAGSVLLQLDPLAAFFLLTISLTCLLGTIYGQGYLNARLHPEPDTGTHFFFLSLLTASMLLVTLLQHALAFLIVWEIMSLASFFLVVHDHEKEEVFEAGFNYLISMHIGAVFLIAGFLTLGNQAGALDFASFSRLFQQEHFPPFWIFLLFLAGFGLKAGFVPLHTWLPRAHPAAPSHVSAIMSGVMIKTGIYGILRVLTWTGPPPPSLGYLVLGIAIASALLGVLYAIAQHDMKRLLAYHSVENIGIIGMGIGAGMLGLAYRVPVMALLGFAGAILHVLNHSFFKSLLFYGTGAIYRALHTRDLEELGGLARTMPLTSFSLITGSAAICGLPPLNGFISEFLIFSSACSGLLAGPAGLTLASAGLLAGLSLAGALALLCFTKFCGVALLGLPRRAQPADVTDPPFTMRLPMLVLAGLILAAGILPAVAFRLVCPAAAILCTGIEMPGWQPFMQKLNWLTLTAGLFIALAAALWGVRWLLLRKRPVEKAKTWDCGYQAGHARMQYTASSFAAPLLQLIQPLLGMDLRLVKPAGLFPRSASFLSHSGNVFEAWLIRPAVKRINRFLDRFTWIQGGSTQRYILYGLIFLVITLLWMTGTS